MNQIYRIFIVLFFMITLFACSKNSATDLSTDETSAFHDSVDEKKSSENVNLPSIEPWAEIYTNVLRGDNELNENYLEKTEEKYLMANDGIIHDDVVIFGGTSLYDANSDGIPELIIRHWLYEGYCDVMYTIINGAAKYLGSCELMAVEKATGYLVCFSEAHLSNVAYLLEGNNLCIIPGYVDLLFIESEFLVRLGDRLHRYYASTDNQLREYSMIDDMLYYLQIHDSFSEAYESYKTSVPCFPVTPSVGRNPTSIVTDIEAILVGVNFDLSGNNKNVEIDKLNGVRIALDEINAAGGVLGKQISLRIYDNEGVNDKAAMNNIKLMDEERVVTVMGGGSSGAVITSAETVKWFRVPIVTATTTADNLTVDYFGDVRDLIYRTCVSDSYQCKLAARFSTEAFGLKKAAILSSIHDSDNRNMTEAFKEEFIDNGGEIVLDVSFQGSFWKADELLGEIIMSGAEIIFCPDNYQSVALISLLTEYIKYNGYLIGISNWDNLSYIKDYIGDSALVKTFFINHYFYGDKTDKNQSFVRKYKGIYDENPTTYAALGYDLMYFIADSISRSDSIDPNEINDAIAGTTGFRGITGAFSMDTNHNPQKDAFVIGYSIDGDYILAGKWENGILITNIPAPESEQSLDDTPEVPSVRSNNIEVSTVEELIKAIAPDTCITMNTGQYDISMVTDIENPFILLQADPNSDNPEEKTLMVNGVDGLTLQAFPYADVEIVTPWRFQEVLSFLQCNDICLVGLKAGHSLNGDYVCEAGVIRFQESRNIFIDECFLYGSGSIGVDLSFCTNALIQNTTITNCSLYAVDLYSSKNIRFSGCKLIDNRAYMNVIHSSDSIVMFADCEISGNRQLNYSVVDTSMGKGFGELYFNRCIFENNALASGSDHPVFVGGGLTRLENCRIEKAGFSDYFQWKGLVKDLGGNVLK